MTTLYITNHNYAPYLAQSIDSALAQTCSSIEVLIIDDGSTDNSKEIIENYRGRKGVRIFYNKNQGLIPTANFAIAQAKGKYIMRLDADDILEPNAVELMTQYLEENKDVAVVFPGYYLCDQEGNTTNTIRRSPETLILKPEDKEPHGACTLIRKSILEELGCYSNYIDCQDGYDLWLKIRNKHKVAALPQALFYYREHNTNLTKDLARIERARGVLN